MSEVAFLYATFPRPTETFVRRELRELGKLGFNPQIFSIWRGEPTWEGKHVNLFPFKSLCLLLFWIPYWAWKRPLAFKDVLGHLWATSCPNLQNWNETFLGLGFALVQAYEFKRKGYIRIHGVWATMPATAAFALHRLIDVPFSMGAHAYDVFRLNGDWLLSKKLAECDSVRTSSQSTGRRLKGLGVKDHRLFIIHRSLINWPRRDDFSLVSNHELKILAVGRLVEKKGYFLMLQIVNRLKENGIPFSLRILGGGPMENELLLETKRLSLSDDVSIQGHCSESEIQRAYLQNDIFIYTGIIASNGDRDGIPNVIPEALSAGMLVLGSNRAGCSEAFVDGQSGISLDPFDFNSWVGVLKQFFLDPQKFASMRRAAVLRAKEQFLAKENCKLLKMSFEL